MIMLCSSAEFACFWRKVGNLKNRERRPEFRPTNQPTAAVRGRFKGPHTREPKRRQWPAKATYSPPRGDRSPILPLDAVLRENTWHIFAYWAPVGFDVHIHMYTSIMPTSSNIICHIDVLVFKTDKTTVELLLIINIITAVVV